MRLLLQSCVNKAAQESIGCNLSILCFKDLWSYARSLLRAFQWLPLLVSTLSSSPNVCICLACKTQIENYENSEPHKGLLVFYLFKLVQIVRFVAVSINP